jgi:multiple sugar transport system substrate-binding protein
VPSEIERSEDQRVGRLTSRRSFLLAVGSTTSVLLLAACGGATAPTPPKAAESKPAEPKPTEPQSGASPAPKPAAPAASPAASPAAGASPAASPSPSPAAAAPQAAPAAKVAAALPNLKGTTLSVLQWSNFVPSTDVLFKKMIEEDFMKNTGAVVNIDFIDQNTIAPKIAAAIQSGSGPDVVQFAHNWPHQYREALTDISDIAQEIQGWTGPFYPGFDTYAKVGGRYLAVPTEFIGTVVHWRKSWFKEAGYDKFPATWEEYFEAGKKLKANGHPLGESLGHSIGDPVFFTNPIMWSYGGSEIDANGKVAINSKETIEAVKLVAAYWKDAFDETGLAWDDSSNNRAFLAETISATQNGASIWWSARDQKVPFFDDIGLDFVPAGPKGRFWMGQLWTMGVMKYSTNVDAAKAFIKWRMTDAVWMQLFEEYSSFICGIGTKQNDNPLWDKFPPTTRVFKQAPEGFRTLGSPGQPDHKVGLSVSKYIVVDMFAKAVQGESPEAAVAWAENELKQVYT